MWSEETFALVREEDGSQAVPSNSPLGTMGWQNWKIENMSLIWI